MHSFCLRTRRTYRVYQTNWQLTAPCPSVEYWNLFFIILYLLIRQHDYDFVLNETKLRYLYFSLLKITAVCNTVNQNISCFIMHSFIYEYDFYSLYLYFYKRFYTFQKCYSWLLISSISCVLTIESLKNNQKVLWRLHIYVLVRLIFST